jgi:integrator complex subunit 1
VDYLPILDPELGSSELVRNVLFARRPRGLHNAAYRRSAASVGIASRPVRPQAYLLSLLTHQASYETLGDTIRALLGPARGDHDPTAVLDFLTACVFIPKLWQGRPKIVPRRLKPDDMLGLEPDQLNRLCDYVLAEMCAGKFLQLSQEIREGPCFCNGTIHCLKLL